MLALGCAWSMRCPVLCVLEGVETAVFEQLQHVHCFEMENLEEHSKNAASSWILGYFIAGGSR